MLVKQIMSLTIKRDVMKIFILITDAMSKRQYIRQVKRDIINRK